MKKLKNEEEMRSEYDFYKLKGGVRGKYAKKLKKGHNLVLLEPDVAKVFRDPLVVNETLRALMKIAKLKSHPAH